MKKRNPFVTALLLVIVISTACHYHRYRTKTVSVNNDHSSLRIEYCGEVVFNSNETAIEEMAPGAYVKYRKNDEYFTARCNDDGVITYKLIDGDTKLSYADAEAKEFVARIVRDIAAHYYR